MKHLAELFSYGLNYVGRVYARGWSMIGRAFLAFLIVSLFLSPLNLIGWRLNELPFISHQTAPSHALVLSGLAILLVYIPLVFYVAGSWVGFCRRIDGCDASHDTTSEGSHKESLQSN
ncbi:MAG: hypothetical protein QM796_06560 [Chthoniobacteraceae bacterium]